jgi:hypothetical protein
MIDAAPLLDGFAVAVTPYHLALMAGGVLLGILVGVLPGLGAPNGVTLLMPLTFSMEPISGAERCDDLLDCRLPLMACRRLNAGVILNGEMRCKKTDRRLCQ